MNRNAVLIALFAASLAAGAWLFRAPAPEPISPDATCTNDASCDAGIALDAVAPEPAVEPSTVARQTPPPAETPTARSEPEPAAPSASPPRAQPPHAAAGAGDALRAEADRLFAAGRPLEGIEKMREATEVDPSAKNHGDLGDLLQRLTAIDDALVHLRQAAELDPGNADRWIALANAYYQAVNPGEAWNAEKRAKEAEPGLVLGRDKNGRRVRQGDSEPRKP